MTLGRLKMGLAELGLSINAYAKRLANAKLVVIPDSRHALTIENPVPFNIPLPEFLLQA